MALKFYAACNLHPIVAQNRYFSTDTVLSEWDGYTAKAGSMLSTYSNAETPSWRAEISPQYYGTFFSRKLSVGVNASAMFSQMPQYSGENLMTAKDNSVSFSPGITYRPSKNFSIVLHPSIIYSKSIGESSQVLSERMLYNGTASLNWRIKKFRVQALGSVYVADYLSGYGTDNSNFRLSANLSYIFNKKFTLGVKGGDLLSKGTTYTSTVSATNMYEHWKPTYGRFLLLYATLEFRNKK